MVSSCSSFAKKEKKKEAIKKKDRINVKRFLDSNGIGHNLTGSIDFIPAKRKVTCKRHRCGYLQEQSDGNR